MSLLTSALRRLHPLSLLLLLIATPILFALGFFWLEIPDSHAWQLALSLVVGAAIAAMALWLFSSTIRRIRSAADPCLHWIAALLLAVWVALWWFLAHLASHLNDMAMQRAGYLNSKLSPSLRVTFTFDRLTAWQHDAVLFLLWVILPALLLPFLIETVSRGIAPRAWHSAAHLLVRWQHWLAVTLIAAFAFWLTRQLIGWRPSHSVHAELISLAFRLLLVYTLDLMLAVLLLAIDSELLSRNNTRRNTVA